jgi:hypothetical protein
MNINTLFDLAQFDKECILVRIHVPVNIAIIVTNAVRAMIAKDRRRQQAMAKMCTTRRATTQGTLRLQLNRSSGVERLH